ncbi:MAG: ATP-binding protein [Pseudomonadota bacterium]
MEHANPSLQTRDRRDWHYRLVKPIGRVLAHGVLFAFVLVWEAFNDRDPWRTGVLLFGSLLIVQLVAGLLIQTVLRVGNLQRIDRYLACLDVLIYIPALYLTGLEQSPVLMGCLMAIVVRYANPMRDLAFFAVLSLVPLLSAAVITLIIDARPIDWPRLLLTELCLGLYASFLTITGAEAYLARLRVERYAHRAKEAAEAKTRFVANISHELRTPLNGLLGMNRLLAETELTDAQRDMVDVARRSGETLLQVINDTLDFAKLDAGRVELDERPLSLRQVLGDLERLLSGLAEDKGLVLRLQIEDDTPAWVLGDETRLRQVVMNVATNAIKFTEKGSVTIALRYRSGEPGEAGQVTIDVADTGIGVSVEQQGRIFDSFSQADSSTTRRFGGTGLGLAIVKELLSIMGGEVTLESELGKGSRFTLCFPAAEAEAPAVNEEVPEGFTAAPGSDLKLLMAEDNHINQRVAAAMIERFGHRLTIVGDGAEAVAAVQQTRYDLVFLDMQMPVMDGLEAARTIRALANPPPLVALTANVDPADRARCAEAGMIDFLAKPLTLEALARVLDAHASAPPRNQAPNSSH